MNKNGLENVRFSLDELLKFGGATLDKNGVAVEFKSGYQVSYKDMVKIKLSMLTQGMYNLILDELERGIDRDKYEYIGMWYDDKEDYVYFDYSIQCKDIDRATRVGNLLDQKAIYDWANGKSIYLNESEDK